MTAATFILFPPLAAAAGFVAARMWSGAPLGERAARRWLGVAIFLAFVALLVVVLRRYSIFRTDCDFIHYVQSAWTTIEGRWLEISGLGFRGAATGSFFREHLFLLTLAFLPLYAAVPDPRVFLVALVLFGVLPALPVFALARDRLGSAGLALAVALLVLLSPFLQRGVATADFHTANAIPLFFLSAAYFLDRDRPARFALSCFLLLAVKEDCFVHVFLLGLYAAIFAGKPRLGLATAAVSLAWGVAAIEWVVPLLRGGESSKSFSRYAGLPSTGLADLAAAIITQPAIAIRQVTDREALYGIAYLSLPFLFLPWLSLRGLLFVVPLTLEMFLSSLPALRLLISQYAFYVLPAYVLAAVFGAERLLARAPDAERARLASGLAGALAAAGVVFLFFFTPYGRFGYSPADAPVWEDGPFGMRFDRGLYAEAPRQERGRALVASVPDGVPAATSARLATRLARRSKLTILPTLGDAEVVVLDLLEEPMRFSRGGAVGTVAFRRARGVVAEILGTGRFGVVRDDGDYVLLEKGAPITGNDRVLRALFGKRGAWEFASHVGRLAPDPEAFGGAALAGARSGYLVHGPGWRLPDGHYSAVFRLRIGVHDRADVARLSVAAIRAGRHEIVAGRLIGAEPGAADGYQAFALDFDARDLSAVEARVELLADVPIRFGGLDLLAPEVPCETLAAFLSGG